MLQPMNRSAAVKVLAYWLEHHYVPDSFRHLFWYSPDYNCCWPNSTLIALVKG